MRFSNVSGLAHQLVASRRSLASHILGAVRGRPARRQRDVRHAAARRALAGPQRGRRPTRRAGAGRVQRARAPRDRSRDRTARLSDHPRRGVPGALSREPATRSRTRLDELRELVRVPAQARRARELAAAIDSYMRTYAAPVRANGLSMAPVDVFDTTAAGKAKMDDLRRRFASFNAAEQALAVARRSGAEASARSAGRLAATGLALSAVLLLLLAAYLRRHVLRPVHRVAVAATRLADGHLDARVPSGGRGEIARLGGAFNTMAASLSQRERELREITDRLEGILEHATISITVKDLDGRYLMVNRRWLEITGFTIEESIGRTDLELFGAELVAPARDSDAEVLRLGTVNEFEREVELQGVRRSYRIVKFPLIDAAGDAYALAAHVDRRHRVPARAGRRGRGVALQVGVPGQHEPRDPHAAQRRDRHDRAAARHRALVRAARLRADRGVLGRGAAGRHQRHPRPLQDRGGPPRARPPRVRPAGGDRGHLRDALAAGARQGPRAARLARRRRPRRGPRRPRARPPGAHQPASPTPSSSPRPARCRCACARSPTGRTR